MAIYQNLSGTTSKSFKIGKNGTLLTTTQTYLQSDKPLLTTKLMLDATGNTYIDSADYTGNANTATKLKTKVNIGISGGATAANINTDLSGDINLNVTSLDSSKLSGDIPWAVLSAFAGTSGSAEKFAREDHTHSDYAATNANLSLIGDVTGSGAINGDITLSIAANAVKDSHIDTVSPSKLRISENDNTIGAEGNVINLYGKASTAGTADYATNLKSNVSHSLVIQSNNTTSFIAPGTSGQVLRSNGSDADPVWASLEDISVGTASAANKLTVSAGSTTKPVYFNEGVPTVVADKIDVSISGKADTAGIADSTKAITNSDGSKSHDYTDIDGIIVNGAKSVKVGASGTSYSATDNTITIPAYTEGATKTEASTVNGKVKINGNDVLVYDDSTLSSAVGDNTSDISDLNTGLTNHKNNTSNPHSVTAAQVGLGSVVNIGQTSSSTDISDATTAANSQTAGLYTRALDVKTFVDNKLSGDLTLGGNVTVNGDLTVKGDTVTIDAENLSISDQLLELYKRSSGETSLAGYAGIYVNNYNGQNNNKVEGLFLDNSANAYVGTGTIGEDNTLTGTNMKKIATEEYVTQQLTNNEEIEVLNIDLSEEATPNTLAKRTSDGMLRTATPVASSDTTSSVNLAYLGQVAKNIVPTTTNVYDLGNASKVFKNVYTNNLISATSTPLSLESRSGLSVTGTVSPSTTKTYDLGTATKQWDKLYVNIIYEDGQTLADKYQPKGDYAGSGDISNKLDKVSSTDYLVYGTDGNNGQAMHKFASSNTANSLVYRDASGNFSAGTITASLSGNATSATKATNDSDNNPINTTYLKKTGGVLTNATTSNTDKNFTISSYTYGGNIANVFDYSAVTGENMLAIGGKSTDTDDYGIKKIEFTVADAAEGTTKSALLTLTKDNIAIKGGAVVTVGANVDIGTSTNKVKNIYADNIQLGSDSLSNYYHALTNGTPTVANATPGTTEVITGLSASNGTLTYTKAKLPTEANNRVELKTASDNKNYSLVFTGATANTDRDYVSFVSTITANPSTGTITATKFSGALDGTATWANGIKVDDTTTVSGATIGMLNSATTSATANTLMYRNAENAVSVNKLYVNEIAATGSDKTLSITGKITEATTADKAKAVWNNDAANTLTFHTSEIYHASDAYVLTQNGTTVKHATIKDLVDDISVAYQNGTYSTMTVGNATKASTADSATKAGKVAYTAAAANTTYYLGALSENTAGDYTPVVTGVTVKGTTITGTLSGSATSAGTATNIAGGGQYQIPYQSTAGATAFIAYPSGINKDYILTADKTNHISWVANPYVRADGTVDMTGGLKLKSTPEGTSENGVDTYSFVTAEGGINFNDAVAKNIKALYFGKSSGSTNAINFYKDDNNFSSLYADGGKLYFTGTRAIRSSGTPSEVVTVGATLGASTLVTNLNADLLDGKHASDFATSSHKQAYTADECTTYTADANTMGVTPAAVKKAFTIFEPKAHNHDGTYLKMTGNTNTSDIPEFSGTPSYLLGIDSFAQNGGVKWKEISSIKVGEASKVTNKLTFKGSDNSDVATYDGSSAVTINKATLTNILGYEPSEVDSALEFKGTLSPTENKITLPTVASTKNGDVWIIGGVATLVNNGSSTLNTAYSSSAVEAGDMIIGFKTGTGASTTVTWTVIQKNIDGAVIGPSSATDNALARFDSTTGKLIQNSTTTIDDNGSMHIRGKLVVDPGYDTATNSYNEGIRVNKASNGWAEIYLGASKDTTYNPYDGWLIGRRGEPGSTSGVVGDLTIEYGYSGGNGLTLPASTGNPTWKGNTIWHAGDDGSGSGLDADKLDGYEASDFKTTYDWRKEINFGATGVLCIGKFVAYDTNITVDISSTTNLTYSGKLVVACQNSKLIRATVYGDPTGVISDAIFIKKCVGMDSIADRTIEIYFKPTAYSKNIFHIQAGALYNSTITDLMTQVDAVPATATTKPTNALKEAFEPIISTKNTAFNVNFGTGNGDAARGDHNHSGVYEPAFTKNTAFNKNFGTTAGTVAEGNHNHSGVYEPAFTKNTGFNKNLGTTAGTVAEGNHNHDSVYMKSADYTAIGKDAVDTLWAEVFA